MLRTILVGLDGSAGSRNTAELAIQWARRHEAMVVGLGVVDEPTIREPAPIPAGAGVYKQESDAARLATARRHVEHFLDQFSLRCAEAGVASKVLESVGLPSEALLRETQRYDLLMVGRESNFHFATQPHDDDTLSAVVRSAGRPVVVVPPAIAAGHGVVVAYDGSPQAARTLQVFQCLAISGAEPIYIVTVGTERTAAAKVADRAVEFLRSHDLTAETAVVVTDRPPGEAILVEAARLGVGLVVSGAYGHSRMRELIFGSTTRHLLQSTTIPLFLDH